MLATRDEKFNTTFGFMETWQAAFMGVAKLIYGVTWKGPDSLC